MSEESKVNDQLVRDINKRCREFLFGDKLPFDAYMLIPIDCVKNAMLIRSLSRAGRDCFEGIIPAPPLPLGMAPQSDAYYMLSILTSRNPCVRTRRYMNYAGEGPKAGSLLSDLSHNANMLPSAFGKDVKLYNQAIKAGRVFYSPSVYDDMLSSRVKIECLICENVRKNGVQGMLLIQGPVIERRCACYMRWIGYKAWQ